MKKMRNGRRGFTLLEIVIVVAIIVILSAGAFLGVAATVNRASETQKNLSMNNGDHFEEYARNQVDSYGKNMVYWDPIPNYTPENQAKKMKEQMLNEGWTDGEITFDYQEDGWHIIAEWDPSIPEHRGFQTPEDYKLWLSNYNAYIKMGYTAEEIEAGCKNGSTDIKPVYNPSAHNGMSEDEYLKQKQGGGSKPVNDVNGGTTPPVEDVNGGTTPPVEDVNGGGTVVEGEGDKDKDKDKDNNTENNTGSTIDYTVYPSNFVGSRPTTNGTIKTATNPGENAPGVKVQDNYGAAQGNFGSGVESFVFHLPAGMTYELNNGGTVTSLGDGYYRWNSTGQYPNNFAIHTTDYSKMTTEQYEGVYFSEIIVH
jgi:type IV pilus assembly protein PilA